MLQVSEVIISENVGMLQVLEELLPGNVGMLQVSEVMLPENVGMLHKFAAESEVTFYLRMLGCCRCQK